MTDTNARWRWARDFTLKAPVTVALLLALGLLLYSFDRTSERFSNAMERMTTVVERLEGAIIELVHTQRSDQEFRKNEHEELQQELKGCKEMGHELSECQRRGR